MLCVYGVWLFTQCFSWKSNWRMSMQMCHRTMYVSSNVMSRLWNVIQCGHVRNVYKIFTVLCVITWLHIVSQFDILVFLFLCIHKITNALWIQKATLLSSQWQWQGDTTHCSDHPCCRIGCNNMHIKTVMIQLLIIWKNNN